MNSTPKRHRLILSVLLLTMAVASSVRAQCTLIGGNVGSGIWSAVNSPYCVTSDVQVASLAIGPGVEIRFLGSYSFSVNVNLQVNGAVGNEVRFTTTNTALGWKGIKFVDVPPGSFFNNCVIERSTNSGISVIASASVSGGVPAFTNCTIRNNSSPDYGGGINLNVQSGDLFLDNCTIIGNTAVFGGGGISAVLTNSMLKMVNCKVASNAVNLAGSTIDTAGAGVLVNGTSVLLNSTFIGNLCDTSNNSVNTLHTAYGGGLCSAVGSCTLRNCRFEGNIAQSSYAFSSRQRSWGAGMLLFSGNLTMLNCIVATNTCVSKTSGTDTNGAGIFIGNAAAEILNCTIVGNNTQGLYATNNGPVTCQNSIFYFNNRGAAQIGGNAAVSYSDIQGGATTNGNKSVNPGLTSGTLELDPTSPCIDMGNPSCPYSDYCFAAEPFCSKGSPVNDMGAYGGPAAYCWAHPCDRPLISCPPQSIAVCIGMATSICVSAIGDLPLRYQWRFYGNSTNNPPTNIPNATNSCLTFTNIQASDAGYYSVRVFNSFGTTNNFAFLDVSPICLTIGLSNGFPRLNLTYGVAGQLYSVRYLTNLNLEGWSYLTCVTQKQGGVFITDPHSANLPQRFYRADPTNNCPAP